MTGTRLSWRMQWGVKGSMTATLPAAQSITYERSQSCLCGDFPRLHWTFSQSKSSTCAEWTNTAKLSKMHRTIFTPFATMLSFAHLIPASVLSTNDGICGASNPVDLSGWELQLPAGEPNTIKNSKLCGSFDNPNFHVDADGTLTMTVPPRTQCVPLEEGQHCRTELREVSTFTPMASQNRLSVKLEIVRGTNICIGQVFREKSEAGSRGPFLQLYWQNGKLKVSLDANTGEPRESKKSTSLGDMQRGNSFSYEIAYERDELSVAIDRKKTNLSVPQDLQRANEKVFFKAGNYNQGGDEGVVRILELKATHSG
ncbi:hypothetical protein AC579_8123 [Pseudocercospora musae]|uniref:Alginate lyase 2 domain-containing protein n=1 Tax=Pseudocercospora musae TaxID=113226 RepID=A0A139IFY8_9PEZI|nr:hypothetical protein AC579_8123 [Pseudocercospora musae]